MTDIKFPKIITAAELETMSEDELERAENRRLSFSKVAAPMISPTTEEGLALAYATRHAGDLRYVASWGRWLKWDGGRWHFEDTLAAFDFARAICRETAAQCNKASESRRLLDARTVAAVEKLAKADRRLAATVDQWDCNAWLLNTPGGVVDLRTGKLRAHNANDYMTRMTAVAPGGECPLWRSFLARITAGNADLEGFLQRFLGYSLTGVTSEHALCFGLGTGANGKGTRSTPWPASWPTTPPSRRWRPSPLPAASAILPTSQCSAAHGWWSPKRPRRAAAGPRARSKH